MAEKSKIVAIEPCSVGPILVNFQNSLPENVEEFSVHVAGRSGKANKGQPLLVTSSADTIYSGRVTKSSLVDNYLVVRNRSTNKMRLVPNTFCSLISEHYTTLPLEIAGAEQDKQTLRYAIAKYGGKNAMRNHDRINRMRVNIDVIKEQLDQTITMSTEQMKLEHMEEERLLDVQDEGVEPPKNYDAKSVPELYDLRQILTQELVDELQEIATQVLDTKPEDLPITSDFLLDKFRGVQNSSTLSTKEKLLTVKTIIFVDALRNLVLQSNHFTASRKPLYRLSMSEICESVEMFIRRNFTDPKSVTGSITKFTRRKAICHYLVLAILLTPKLEMATEEIITELKIRKEELLDFARFLNLRTALNNSFLGLRLSTSKKDDDSRKIRRVKIGKKK